MTFKEEVSGLSSEWRRMDDNECPQEDVQMGHMQADSNGKASVWRMVVQRPVLRTRRVRFQPHYVHESVGLSSVAEWGKRDSGSNIWKVRSDFRPPAKSSNLIILRAREVWCREQINNWR